MNIKVCFIGAGNLATQLSKNLVANGITVSQIYSRTGSSAQKLASQLGVEYTSTIPEIDKCADIYIVALKDSVIEEVLAQCKFKDKLVVHCSGSVSIEALKNYSANVGVFYPLQTFSKIRDVDFSSIPIFIEGNTKDNEDLLLNLAQKLSNQVSILSSEKRKYLHISAVFACNFVNHFYNISAQILNSKGIDFEMLRPLILETAQKVQTLDPKIAQTGPAVRFDENIISAHLRDLEGLDNYAELYKSISKSIFEHHKKVDGWDFFKEELLKVEAFVFDVDGVLSKDTSPLSEDGDPVRTANVKDGFAIRNALDAGYPIAIITGGFLERVRLRYEKLGVKHYYDKANDKVRCLNDFLDKTGLSANKVLFMGDDLVDYKIMLKVGLPTCPKDAVSEIKSISKYISSKNGGEGCVRDVIEQTMRAQKKWFTDSMKFKKHFRKEVKLNAVY